MPIRITELPQLSGSLASADLLEIVDVSDTGVSGSGTSKSATISQLASALRSGLRAPAVVASDVPVTLNSSVVIGGVVNGRTLSDGDRVLLLNQTNTIQNGLWEVTSGSPIRPSDFAAGTSSTGVLVPVLRGTYASKVFVCTSLAPDDIVNTNAVYFLTIGLADGNYGDITVSGNGTSVDINDGSITSAAFADFTSDVMDALGGQIADTNSLALAYTALTHILTGSVRRRTTGLVAGQGTLSETGAGLVVDLGTSSSVACAGDDARLSNSRTPTSHASTHQSGGSDEIATTTPASGAIPKAETTGLLGFGWFPIGQTGITLCVGNDPRLSNARTPTAHASTHGSAGSDPLTLAMSQITGLTTVLNTKVDTAGTGLTKSGTTLGISTQANNTLFGNISGSTNAPVALTVSQVKTLLNYLAGDISGLGTMAVQNASAVNISGGAITGINDPASASDVATKAYVDSVAAGLKWKQNVKATTTANVTLATGFENGDTIDGVTLATGDRILIKDQTDKTVNGIYVVQASGAPVRSADADSASELISACVIVTQGSVNANKGFICTNSAITEWSTDIIFVDFNSAITNALLTTNNLSDLTSVSTARSNLGLGDSAVKNVGTGSGTVAAGNDSRFSDARVPLTHATSHQHGGSDEIAVATAAANAIPKAAVSGKLDIGWFPLGTDASSVVVGNDSRLSDAREPTAHATTHKTGGTDALRLDELEEPTDNTNLNASVSAHGLLPKLDNNPSHYLDGTGQWSPLSEDVVGLDAFTFSTATFNMPNNGANVTVQVEDSRWMQDTLLVYVTDGTNGAYMTVVDVPDDVSVTLTPTNVHENVVAGTTFAVGSYITPSGTTGPALYGGAVALRYQFSTITTNSDPTSGKLRLSHATQRNSTSAYISKDDADVVNVGTVLAQFDASSSTNKGYLRIVSKTNPSDWLLFAIRGREDDTNYTEITLTNIAYSGNSPFSDGEEIIIEFTRTGDKGTEPTTPGVTTDNALVRWDGTDGSAIQNSLVTLSDVGKLHYMSSYTDIAEPANVAGVVTLNLTTSDHHMHELTEDVEIAVSNVSIGQEFWLLLTLNQFQPTWFSTIVWAGGHYPHVPRAENGWILCRFACVGVDEYGGGIYYGWVEGSSDIGYEFMTGQQQLALRW